MVCLCPICCDGCCRMVFWMGVVGGYFAVIWFVFVQFAVMGVVGGYFAVIWFVFVQYCGISNDLCFVLFSLL